MFPLLAFFLNIVCLAVPSHLLCFLVIMGHMKQPPIPTREPFFIRVVPQTGSYHCEEGMKDEGNHILYHSPWKFCKLEKKSG